jgi:hypothetical protein
VNATRSFRAILLTLGLVVGAVALAACGADPQSAPSSVASQSADTSTASATPSATPTQSDAGPAGWTVDFDGVGPFLVGEDVADAVAAVPPPYAAAPASACPNPATQILQSDSSPTIWLQDLAGTGRIDVVAVGGDAPGDPRETGSPQTESGVGVGSSLEDVQSAFPGSTLETDLEGQPDRLVVSGIGSSGDARYLVFGFFDSTVQTISVQASSEKVWEFCG